MYLLVYFVVDEYTINVVEYLLVYFVVGEYTINVVEFLTCMCIPPTQLAN